MRPHAPGRLPEYPLEWVHSAVVVTACTQDGIVGFGGSIARLAASGSRLRLVVITGPEAAEAPASTAGALAELGAAGAELVPIQVPPAAPADGLTEVMRPLYVAVHGFDLCVAPYGGSRREDERAVRWATLLACSLRPGPVLVEYAAALTPAHGSWERAARIPLTGDETTRKQRAVERLGSPPPSAAQADEWELVLC
jgi:hypothetical protein